VSNGGNIVGVLLAGGQARRMGGGDKCLRLLGGRPILDQIIERTRPQVYQLVLNANGNHARFKEFKLPVIADSIKGFAGPLAGVLAGLDWAASCGHDYTWVATFATDAPFVPVDLVQRMRDGIVAENADMACASSNGRRHPVFGLWPVILRDDLRQAMTQEKIRKVDMWTARHRLAIAEFPVDTIDPFFNANRPEDLERAEAWVKG